MGCPSLSGGGLSMTVAKLNSAMVIPRQPSYDEGSGSNPRRTDQEATGCFFSLFRPAGESASKMIWKLQGEMQLAWGDAILLTGTMTAMLLFPLATRRGRHKNVGPLKTSAEYSDVPVWNPAPARSIPLAHAETTLRHWPSRRVCCLLKPYGTDVGMIQGVNPRGDVAAQSVHIAKLRRRL